MVDVPCPFCLLRVLLTESGLLLLSFQILSEDQCWKIVENKIQEQSIHGKGRLAVFSFWFFAVMNVSDFIEDFIEASRFLILCVFEADIIDIVFLYIFDELVQLMFLVQPAINGVEMLSRLLIDLRIDVIRPIQEMLIAYLVVNEHRPSKEIILSILIFPNAFKMLQEV